MLFFLFLFLIHPKLPNPAKSNLQNDSPCREVPQSISHGLLGDASWRRMSADHQHFVEPSSSHLTFVVVVFYFFMKQSQLCYQGLNRVQQKMNTTTRRVTLSKQKHRHTKNKVSCSAALTTNQSNVIEERRQCLRLFWRRWDGETAAQWRGSFVVSCQILEVFTPDLFPHDQEVHPNPR